MTTFAPSLPGFTNDVPLLVMLDAMANDDAESAYIIDLFGGINGFRPADPGKFRAQIREVLTKVVTAWNSRPGQANTIDVSKITDFLTEPFFMKLGFRVDDGVFENISKYSAGDPPRLASLKERGDEWMMTELRDRVRVIVRSYANLLIQYLANGTLSYTRDGVAVTETNVWVPTAKCLAAWSTASTKIHTEWKRVLRLFSKQAGGPPTHVLVGPNFAEECLLSNTFLLDFIKYNPAFLSLQGGLVGSLVDLGGIVRGPAPYEVHEVGLYNDSGTELWDDDQIVLIRNPKSCLRHYAPRTLDAGTLDSGPELRPGIYTDQWAENNPKALWEAVGLSAAPVVSDPTQILRVDIKTP